MPPRILLLKIFRRLFLFQMTLQITLRSFFLFQMTLHDNPSKFVPLSDDSALCDILQLTAVTIMTRVNLTINNNWSPTKFDSIQNTFLFILSLNLENINFQMIVSSPQLICKKFIVDGHPCWWARRGRKGGWSCRRGWGRGGR